MRVASWNVLWKGRDDRLDLVTEHLARIQADVVMLQETSPSHAAQVAKALGMEVAGVPDSTDTTETSVPALLARTHADTRLVRLPDQPDGRPAWLIYADLAQDETTYRVATTHLAATASAWRMCLDERYGVADSPREIQDFSIRTTVEARLQQLDVVLEHLGDPSTARVILGGDLNFPEAGPEHRRVLTSGLNDAARQQPRLGTLTTVLAQNPLVEDHPDTASFGQRRGATTALDYALDHFFTAPAVNAEDVWTFGTADFDGNWPSDHLGLAGDFR